MRRYRKCAVAVLGGVVAYVAARYGAQEWAQAVVYTATALGVYGVPNDEY